MKTISVAIVLKDNKEDSAFFLVIVLKFQQATSRAMIIISDLI